MKFKDALMIPTMALCAILSLCACSSLGESGSRIPGMVYSMDGSPVAGARIRVDGGPPSVSDREGRFSIGRPLGLRAGKAVLLEAEHAGCESLRERVLLPGKEGILYLSMRSAPDLRNLSLKAMRDGDWGEALRRAYRAQAVWPGAESRFLIALLLSAPANPLKDNARARVILDAMRAEGMANEWVEKLSAELAEEDKKLVDAPGDAPPQ